MNRTSVPVCLLFCCAGVAILRAPAVGAETKLLNVQTSSQLLDACEKAGGGGWTIVLAPGVYELDRPLTFRKANQTRIAGSGWNTVLRRKGDGNAIEILDSGFVEVKDLLIEGSADAKTGSGIVFRGASSCTVDFCRIDGFAESGVRFEGDPKVPMSSNTVSRCHFISNRRDQLYSYANNDFYILQNQFGTHRGTPQTGCRLDHSSAGTYSLNYHWGNVNALRLGPASHFNRIQNNRFEESREAGLVIGESKGGGGCVFNTISGNTFHTNSKGAPGKFPAVEAYDAAETTFTGNQAFSWDSDSTKHSSSLVLGRGCANWIVTGNTLKHNTGKALVYDSAAGHIVKDNLTQDGE